jgi:NhaA family Na+:H+ antiporter
MTCHKKTPRHEDLMIAAAIATILVANSGLSEGYNNALSSVFSLTINGEGLSKPLILLNNDSLMAVFFFLIGMALKREMREGKLKNPRNVILPGMAAIGGMAAQGWAILIIVFFYTAELKIDDLLLALFPLPGLACQNVKGAHRIAPPILLGTILWALGLKSGVRITLAGVITALWRKGRTKKPACVHAGSKE